MPRIRHDSLRPRPRSALTPVKRLHRRGNAIRIDTGWRDRADRYKWPLRRRNFPDLRRYCERAARGVRSHVRRHASASSDRAADQAAYRLARYDRYELPPLQALFGATPLDAAAWTPILGLGFAKFLAVEAEKAVLRRFGVQRL